MASNNCIAESDGSDIRAVTSRSFSFRNRGAEMNDEGGMSNARIMLVKQMHAFWTVVGGGFVLPLEVMKEQRDTINGHEDRSDAETPARIESERVDLSCTSPLDVLDASMSETRETREAKHAIAFSCASITVRRDSSDL